MNFFRQRFQGNNHIASNQLCQIPLPAAGKSDQTAISKLVSRILKAKAKNSEAHTALLEREVDSIVNRLYGFTKTEVKVIESQSGATSLSRAVAATS